MPDQAGKSWFGGYRPRTIGPPPREVATIFAAEMASISMGRFPRACEPIVVPLKSYRGLLGATRRLLDLHRAAVANLAADSSERVVALKADPADFPRFAADDEFELGHAIDVSRADVVISADGPRFVELNVGAGIGGMVEFELERRIWQRIWEQAGEPALTGVSLFKLVAGLIERTCGDLGIAPSALLIGSLEDIGKSTRNFDVQIEVLREHGIDAQFTDLRNLSDHIGSAMNPADVLGIVEFNDREANANGWDMSPLAAAMKAGLVAIPSQTARLLDSKKVLALLSEGLPWMSAEDHKFVQQVVPWTRVVAERTVEWQGRSYPIAKLLLDQQESFVLKGSAGFSSQEVFFGAASSPGEWGELVTSAMESEYYVAQEVVTPVRHPVHAMLDATGNAETVMANSAICPFCVDGIPTGCYMRFDPTDRVGPVARPYGAYPGCLLGAAS